MIGKIRLLKKFKKTQIAKNQKWMLSQIVNPHKEQTKCNKGLKQDRDPEEQLQTEGQLLWSKVMKMKRRIDNNDSYDLYVSIFIENE